MFDGTPNVHLLEQAVSVDEGKAALYRAADFASDPDRFVQASSLFSSHSKGGDVVAVEQIDFCAFIAALPQRVAILKMDIEGAEVPIIERLLDTGLVERIDYIFAETHERIFPDLAARTLTLRRRIAREGRLNINLDWV
jgi:FkbM family methyltransferase